MASSPACRRFQHLQTALDIKVNNWHFSNWPQICVSWTSRLWAKRVCTLAWRFLPFPFILRTPFCMEEGYNTIKGLKYLHFLFCITRTRASLLPHLHHKLRTSILVYAIPLPPKNKLVCEQSLLRGIPLSQCVLPIQARSWFYQCLFIRPYSSHRWKVECLRQRLNFYSLVMLVVSQV